MFVENKDWKYWEMVMSIELVLEKNEKFCCVFCLCFGYVDLVGGMKYGYNDMCNVLECFSVCEMIVCVVVGVVVKKLLYEFGIEVVGYVFEIGGICVNLICDYVVREI